MTDPTLDPEVTQPPAPSPVSDATPVVAGAPPGYEMLGELGRGGMGVVYQARQVKANRVVALKMILAGAHAGAEQLAYPEASARFFREAQALARLNHPNILTLYESGQDGDTYYLVMELGGPDLETLLEFAAGPLPGG